MVDTCGEGDLQAGVPRTWLPIRLAAHEYQEANWNVALTVAEAKCWDWGSLVKPLTKQDVWSATKRLWQRGLRRGKAVLYRLYSAGEVMLISMMI